MATPVKDRCDVLVDAGKDFFITVGKYVKAGQEEKQYNFGVSFDYPTVIKEMADSPVKRYSEVGFRRIVDVSKAPFAAAIRDGKMEEADIVAWAQEYTGDAFDIMAEKAPGEPKQPKDTTETLAIRYLAKVLRDKGEDIPESITVLGAAPKTEKGQVNFIAWAKALKAADHKWYAVAVKKVTPKDKDFE